MAFPLRVVRARRFPTSIAIGVLLVFGSQWLVNRTPVADWIVAPLLVPDSTARADVIMVLGAGVIADCVPNNNGLRRVLLAMKHWRQQPSARLLFTGGSGGPCTAAEAMGRLARELGVPAALIDLERTSKNTHENATMGGTLLRARGVSQVLLVTDRLHMRRALGVVSREGLVAHPVSVPIYEGHEDNVSMLVAGLREFTALAYYRLRGWLDGDNLAGAAMGAAMPHNPEPTGPGPIVLLGASYAASWPVTELAGAPVINRGIAGEQSFEMLARFDSDVVAVAPRAVILWGFINDIFRSPPEVETTIARIKDSYTQMIARARLHGIVPILATEVTTRPPSRSFRDKLAGWAGWLMGKPAYQDGINELVLTVNQWIVETGAREGLLVLHLQEATAERGGRRIAAFAQEDGSHITPAGYDHLMSYARPVIEEFFVVR